MSEKRGERSGRGKVSGGGRDAADGQSAGPYSDGINRYSSMDDENNTICSKSPQPGRI
jgi:hypothetical protein